MATVAMRAVGNCVLNASIRIDGMKVRVGECNVVRDDDTAADRNPLRTHEHTPDQYRIVPYFDASSRLHVERGPCEYLRPAAKSQSRILLAAKSRKAVTTFEPAAGTHPHVRGQRSVVPRA